MEKTVRTAVGGLLQTAQKLKLPYDFVDNSIMNKQLGILPDELPTQIPWTQYVTIGIGGLGARYFDNNTRAEIWPMPHSVKDTGMYRQVPFVMRAVGEDLTSVEAQRFRLRTIETVDGVQYACYYARKLDTSVTNARLEYRQIVDGQIISTPWEPSPSDQHPVPPVVNPGQVLETGDDYIAATAKSAFVFTPWDVTELVNVGKILFKSETSIILTELALCSGEDFEFRGSFNGVMRNYMEAVGVQINDFVSTFMPAAFQRAGAAINLDIGTVEPLLALRSNTGVS